MSKRLLADSSPLFLEEPILERLDNGRISARVRFRIGDEEDVAELRLELVNDEWSVHSCSVVDDVLVH